MGGGGKEFDATTKPALRYSVLIEGVFAETGMRLRQVLAGIVVCAGWGCAMAIGAAQAEPRHGIAMYGTPKHGADMRAFPYVNPDAPKGGRLSLGVSGSFDSLNPLTYRGSTASGVREYVYESLLARSGDEPFSLYGLIAESIDMAADRSAITFRLRKAARFSDGQPITSKDVLFSHALLRDKGWPGTQSYYKRVDQTEAPDAHTVRFTFKAEADGSYDRELPLILGLLTVLPSHLVKPESFDETSLAVPVGSGPYLIDRVDAGRSVTFKRRADWWAKDLPVMRGRFNFDEVRHEYFRDDSVLFEAFKAGEIDLLSETDPVRWATAYAFPAIVDGRIVKREFATRLPAGMAGLVFNTRRTPFTDIRVREALIDLFDFAWINRNLYGGLYKRTESYFERSDLSSAGRPADGRERALLGPFGDAVRPGVLDGSYRLPLTDGSGNNRTGQQAAVEKLAGAGYRLQGKRMVHTATGKPLTFEVLATKRGQERLLLTFARALEAVGITLSLRFIDSAQYEARLKDKNFDMIQTVWASSLSPGNEQAVRFGSATADVVGTRNYAGVKSPATDAMIKAILAAETADEFVSAVRAHDRVLRSGAYVIPLFHLPNVWITHSARLRVPEVAPNSGIDLDTWWLAQ